MAPERPYPGYAAACAHWAKVRAEPGFWERAGGASIKITPKEVPMPPAALKTTLPILGVVELRDTPNWSMYLLQDAGWGRPPAKHRDRVIVMGPDGVIYAVPPEDLKPR